MGNKQQLQLNNETLDSILSNVLGLPSQESLKQGAYVWKKLTAEGGDFIDFVVSDNESAYPDGGERGGYWYEKVKEGINPSLFGCTKCAIDTFTFSSDTALNSVSSLSHSLGEEPKEVLIYATDPNITTEYIVLSIVASSRANTGKAYAAAGATTYSPSYNAKCQHLSDNNSAITIRRYTSDISVSGSSSYKFKAGIEYTLITMA